jgi:hypothetical protein
MAKRRVAMVQGPPLKSAEDLPIFVNPDLEDKLIKTLKLLKNTRAYTVLEYHHTWASVHFEGDLSSKTITYQS